MLIVRFIYTHENFRFKCVNGRQQGTCYRSRSWCDYVYHVISL